MHFGCNRAASLASLESAPVQGFFCAEGSSVRLRASCAGGTYSPPGAKLADQSDCAECPKGWQVFYPGSRLALVSLSPRRFRIQDPAGRTRGKRGCVCAGVWARKPTHI